MSRIFSEPSSKKVLIVDPSVTVRKSLQDALRKFGFSNFTGVAEVSDVLEMFETETFDWVITSVHPDAKVNGLQLLRVLSQNRSFRHLRISFLIREEEAFCLPLAFELGLLSFHDRSLPGKFEESFGELVMAGKLHHFDSVLMSAVYLRKYLRDLGAFNLLEKFEKNLLKQRPGNLSCLLSLVEAKVGSGDVSGADRLLFQIGVLGERQQELAEQMRAKYKDALQDPLSLEEGVGGAACNTIGVETVLLVDPDETVHYNISRLFAQAGVPNVHCFASGKDAFGWVEQGGRPDLIIHEWRLDDLPGFAFVQRIRSSFGHAVPIIVVSSLIQPSDHILLREMMVSDVVNKPFDHEQFMTSVVNVLQQHRAPQDSSHLFTKAIKKISVGDLAEAKRLFSMGTDVEHDECEALVVKTRLYFAEGKYKKAIELAVAGLKKFGDQISLLDTLGKALLQTRDFKNAVKCFERAKSLSPCNISRLCELTMLYTKEDRFDKASDSLAVAKAIDGQNEKVRTTSANFHLATGDTEKARQDLADVEQVVSVLGFMNNRAVALIKNSRWSEGIELYKSTIDALPPQADHYKEIVIYNLALANVRFSDYDEALVWLDRIAHDESTPTRRKAVSLRSRLVTALEAGVPIVLKEADQEKEVHTPRSSSDSEEEMDLVTELETIDVAQGELCCFRLFFAESLLTKEQLNLIRKMPRFRTREAISREETMDVAPGAAPV